MTTLKTAMYDLTKEGGPLDLGPDQSRFFVRMIREIASGRPVSDKEVARIIDELGLSPDEARDFLERWTERDAKGNVVGLGISLNETPHRYTTSGTQLFAWCALDTLVFPMVLNRTGHVESISPASGQTSTLEVTTEGIENVRPPGTVISLPLVEANEVDTGSVQAIWTTFCHRSYFFPSREEADRWGRDKKKIDIASLDDGVEFARQVAARMLAHED
jgi:alkylmercury lyase